MNFPNDFASIAIAGTVVAAAFCHTASAQDFTLFEHAIAQPGDVHATTKRTPQGVTSRQRIAISYRENLYRAAVSEVERQYALPQNLLRALIWAESRFDPMAISSAGAAGLAQLMPATARELGVRNRHDPLASIDGGARYLRDMLKRFGAVHLALAAYNAGPGAISRSGGIPNNGETPQYVRSVLARWEAINAHD
ncbi:lytic transglycosylase domain-containing protein [Erythrobacter sp. EC-HK427]|uniref:lytic transglycosylase domain-containing protein n=1 Tax=Erythrobacter sp. EC-HK427 TaxID=2038396 RepID=UPI00125EC542|nr:lytic transglycosylase domain-containing protein [Erythrobacter sp. EC-HK427]